MGLVLARRKSRYQDHLTHIYNRGNVTAPKRRVNPKGLWLTVDCSYTERYRAQSSALGNIFDLFVGT